MSTVKCGMASFDRLADSVTTPDKGEMIATAESQVWVGNLGVTITTHQGD